MTATLPAVKTIVVWICIMWTGNTNVVVDNIATEFNCQGLLRAANVYNSSSGHCFAVRKAVVR